MTQLNTISQHMSLPQCLEDQRAPRPVEPEVLANDGDVLAREAHDVPAHLASALEFADIRARKTPAAAVQDSQ